MAKYTFIAHGFHESISPSAIIEDNTGRGRSYDLSNISVSLPSDGTTADVADYNTPITTIVSDYNGNIDNSNISASAAIANSKLADDSGITYAKVAAGFIVQVAVTNFSAVATGTTAFPYDDNIPQNTGGTEFMTRAITPKSATNRLFIEAKLVVSHTIVQELNAALFQDSTANALAAVTDYGSSATGERILYITHDMVAGTTSSTTFKVRAGGATGATMTFNGRTGTRKFGGVTLSTFKITEYKA